MPWGAGGSCRAHPSLPVFLTSYLFVIGSPHLQYSVSLFLKLKNRHGSSVVLEAACSCSQVGTGEMSPRLYVQPECGAGEIKQ